MAKSQTEMFEFNREPIKGFPELRWAGKRPFTGTSYYPAQLKETHGHPSDDGWMNKLYWGDNLQVMSHLLKECRGQVDLIYIDPPFDSKADYKKTISLRNQSAESDSSNFEEKQYGDIWTNDEYLQFMYERLILCRELLSDKGSIYLHCDWHKSHYLRNIMDEIFGIECFQNEISWLYKTGGASKTCWARKHDTLLFYSKKNSGFTFNPLQERSYMMHKYGFKKSDFKIDPENGLQYSMVYCRDVWEMPSVGSATDERVDYPTQKPEVLLERIIKASSNPGDVVFDCFMGSGTTQTVAMKLGRKFIGADINLGAIQTTTKRLISTASKCMADKNLLSIQTYTGFEVYNVNDYDFFRNELEAKKLIIEALGMQALPENSLWDAEFDGRMVAILGINRIATASEFEKIVANIDISSWQKKQNENPGKPVEKITFVCMGHDPNLEAMFHEKMASLGFVVDLEIIDILRDKKELTFKRDADAKISIANGKLSIEQFYPMNLLQKLSFEKQDVEDWKELVDSVMIDWNYDGVAFAPALTDIPAKNALVKGIYNVPEDAGTIHVKITDLISESWEGSFSVEGSKL
ncbi:site-specific DNA-methyltransferase [Fibrobacter sp. UWB5]|uniref:site-specific DNA-methyltransferase n=1 Tax=Fibrobacter sp. UWB5 TaxID=1964360 RepID=UPI000B524B90|nr:site-specific DNA-methyltransferase [Fibrobacter sp. UWB5]OWV13478.1 site-specific DNA-methyltransferase [Fibrobacter sp. UWB5]